MPNNRFQTFKTQEAASAAAADAIFGHLTRALGLTPSTSLIVSGGSTPRQALTLLGQKALPWSHIHVTLTDERDVDPGDDRSNEKMIRQHLMAGEANEVLFHPLIEGMMPEIPLPAACSLVGMGEDGHFASLFPDLADLPALLSPDAPASVHRTHPDTSDISRLTLNVSALMQTRHLLLLAFGAAKRRIIERPDGYPVAALLKQHQVPLTVIWAA